MGTYNNFNDRSVSYTTIEHYTITGGIGADVVNTATGDEQRRGGGAVCERKRGAGDHRQRVRCDLS